MDKTHFSRRELLKLSAMAGLASMAPGFLPKGFMSAQAAGALDWTKTLVMIKFDGGNDGLNTIIPYEEKNYGAATRPNLFINKSGYTIINQTAPVAPLVTGSQVSPHFAYNNALAPLMDSAGTGPANIPKDLVVALGVGYPDNASMGSHFYSSDVWGTANSTTTAQPNYGWISNIIGRTGNTPGVVDAAMVGSSASPEAIGGVFPNGALINTAFSPGNGGSTYNEEARDPLSQNAVYSWLFQQQRLVDAIDERITNVTKIPLKNKFPATTLGTNLAHIAQLIINGKSNPIENIPILSVYHNQPHSFDTHVSQVVFQTQLLQDFASSLAVFRQEMIDQGLWNDVVVMTHSEFGRSLFENSALGTDHGKANAHFITGGSVAGGKYIGAAPDLNYGYNNATNMTALGPVPFVKNGPGMQAPEATMDFRQIYATIIQDLWKGSSSLSEVVLGGNYNTVPIIGTV